ncbi:MAG: phenylalanine--tRNA ligase subunit beta, partial [Bauldia sp.]|nr:phenylalanine--tRNA ligase subunit beta [Bauldia sp.]
TLSWLKEHLDTIATVDGIADRLTMIGLEVESVEDPSKAFAAFRIADVVSAEQHPNADRLRVCMVDVGEGPVQVVCGAPNARAGMRGVFAPAGTYIPGTGAQLEKGVIRGVESNGMLLSERELGISDAHDGIVDLPADAAVGTPYAEYAGLTDPVIDVAVTANRGDALGVAGIARDLAAAGEGRLIDWPIDPVPGDGPCPVKVSLAFGDTPSLCPAFGLRLVRGVTNGPSPQWLQRRLRAIGLRPINALVDITNFLTYDRGRPLHVFDAAKVKGDLVVRRARDGETVLALDGKTYALDPDICVIADDNGVESVAGVMGGEVSGCTEETTDVLIESALWEPLNIAATGRRLGLHSDARHRFERGVDPAFMLPGLELATRMVLDLCGGTPSEIVVAGEVPEPRAVIDFPVAEIRRLAGIDPSVSDVTAILEALGFACRPHRLSGTITVSVPTWRPDVTIKADLVEEVVRIIGVDRVPVTPMRRDPGVLKPVLTPIQLRTRRAKRALAARGLVEAVTWSFISHAAADAFGGGKPELVLANPIAADMSDMRPSLLPGLLAAAQRNADRGHDDLALFEVGQVYRGDRPEDQVIAASGVRRGTAGVAGSGRHWSGKAAPVGVFDAKADALAILDVLGLPPEKVQVVAEAPAWFHPGRSGTIRLGPKNVIGWFGAFHPRTLEALDVDGPLAGFELILDAIPLPRVKATKTRPPLVLSDLQPVKRDFAFVLDRGVEAAKVVRAAESADKKLVSGVSVFDLFEGEALGAGKKSLAIQVTLQPKDHTLTDEEIDAVGQKVIAEVAKATGGTLRT